MTDVEELTGHEDCVGKVFCVATHKPGVCAGTKRGTRATPAPVQAPRYVQVKAVTPGRSAQQVTADNQQDATYGRAMMNAQRLARQLGGPHAAMATGAVSRYGQALHAHYQATSAVDRAHAASQAAHDRAVKTNADKTAKYNVRVAARNAAIKAAQQHQQAQQHATKTKAAHDTAYQSLVAKLASIRAAAHRRDGTAASSGLAAFDLYAAPVSAADWLYGNADPHHFWCNPGAFCRNPLHPGPCKGWKHTLHSVAPGAYHAYEKARVDKLNVKRTAKIKALQDAGKPVPKSLLKPITYDPSKLKPQASYTPPTPKESEAALPATAKEISAKIAQKHADIAEAHQEKIKGAALQQAITAHRIGSAVGASPGGTALLSAVKKAGTETKPGQKVSDHPEIQGLAEKYADAASKMHVDAGEEALTPEEHADAVKQIQDHIEQAKPGLPLLVQSAVDVKAKADKAAQAKKDAAAAAEADAAAKAKAAAAPKPETGPLAGLSDMQKKVIQHHQSEGNHATAAQLQEQYHGQNAAAVAQAAKTDKLVNQNVDHTPEGMQALAKSLGLTVQVHPDGSGGFEANFMAPGHGGHTGISFTSKHGWHDSHNFTGNEDSQQTSIAKLAELASGPAAQYNDSHQAAHLAADKLKQLDEYGPGTKPAAQYGEGGPGAPAFESEDTAVGKSLHAVAAAAGSPNDQEKTVSQVEKVGAHHPAIATAIGNITDKLAAQAKQAKLKIDKDDLHHDITDHVMAGKPGVPESVQEIQDAAAKIPEKKPAAPIHPIGTKVKIVKGAHAGKTGVVTGHAGSKHQVKPDGSDHSIGVQKSSLEATGEPNEGGAPGPGLATDEAVKALADKLKNPGATPTGGSKTPADKVTDAVLAKDPGGKIAAVDSMTPAEFEQLDNMDKGIAMSHLGIAALNDPSKKADAQKVAAKFGPKALQDFHDTVGDEEGHPEHISDALAAATSKELTPHQKLTAIGKVTPAEFEKLSPTEQGTLVGGLGMIGLNSETWAPVAKQQAEKFGPKMAEAYKIMTGQNGSTSGPVAHPDMMHAYDLAKSMNTGQGGTPTPLLSALKKPGVTKAEYEKLGPAGKDHVAKALASVEDAAPASAQDIAHKLGIDLSAHQEAASGKVPGGPTPAAQKIHNSLMILHGAKSINKQDSQALLKQIDGLSDDDVKGMGPSDQLLAVAQLAKVAKSNPELHDQALARVQKLDKSSEMNLEGPFGILTEGSPGVTPAAPLGPDAMAHVKAAQSLATGATSGTSKAKVAAYEKLTPEEYHALPQQVQELIHEDLLNAQVKFLDPAKKQQVTDVLQKLGVPGAPQTAGQHEHDGTPNIPAAAKQSTSHAGGKFEILKDTGQNGDGYFQNPDGSTGPWGKFGAAGVLIRAKGADGQWRYLMVKRGDVDTDKSKAGKWQLPGGALNSAENAHQGAARETQEELGATPEYLAAMQSHGEHQYKTAGGWTYTSIAATAPHTFTPKVDGTETADAKWMTQEEIDQLDKDGQLVDPLAGGKIHTNVTSLFGAAPAKTAAKKPAAPKPVEHGAHLTDLSDPVLKQKLTTAYKSQPNGSSLNHPDADVYRNLLAITSAYSTPKKPLSMFQVIRAIDEMHYAKLDPGEENAHRLEDKITAFLKTPEGQKLATTAKPDPALVAQLKSDAKAKTSKTGKPQLAKVGGPGPYKASKKPADFHPIEDAEATKLQEDYMDAHNAHWSQEQAKALKSYTSSSSAINEYLRNPNAAVPASVKQEAQLIQSAMRPIQRDIRLVRGTGFSEFPAGFDSAATIKGLVGKTFTEDAFVSTTVSGSGSGFSGQVRLDIEAPAGTMGAYVEQISTFKGHGEYEYLLAAGTRLKVLGVEQQGSKWVVRVRVVSTKS